MFKKYIDSQIMRSSHDGGISPLMANRWFQIRKLAKYQSFEFWRATRFYLLMFFALLSFCLWNAIPKEESLLWANQVSATIMFGVASFYLWSSRAERYKSTDINGALEYFIPVSKGIPPMAVSILALLVGCIA